MNVQTSTIGLKKDLRSHLLPVHGVLAVGINRLLLELDANGNPPEEIVGLAVSHTIANLIHNLLAAEGLADEHLAEHISLLGQLVLSNDKLEADVSLAKGALVVLLGHT